MGQATKVRLCVVYGLTCLLGMYLLYGLLIPEMISSSLDGFVRAAYGLAAIGVLGTIVFVVECYCLYKGSIENENG